MSIKNGEQFLPNSINDIEINISVGDEVLVIDDGSDDKTSSILNLWARRNAQVRILKNRGKGLVDSLNLGAKESINNWLVRFSKNVGLNRIRSIYYQS
jgi:glycosyltransferase involved in cell wall biosynthesis